MIAECLIFLASFSQPAIEVGTVENMYTFHKIQKCADIMPSSMMKHADLYVEHFDKENLYTAVRIGWCESRGNEKAVRTAEGNYDSGVMQFVPWTWNWVAELHDMPMWNDTVILYHGEIIEMHPRDTHLYDTDFLEIRKVQLVPQINIKMASLLAEDTYSKTTFRDWNSSKWCWGNPNYFERKWREEGY